MNAICFFAPDWRFIKRFHAAVDAGIISHALRGGLSFRLLALLPSCLLAYGYSMALPPSTAFFYGSPVPVLALSKFDRVVVEAENVKDLAGLRVEGADIFAYVSVGEAEGWRATSSALPRELFMGNNVAWHSRIADLTQPGWRDYLIEQRMARLWDEGYRAFSWIRWTAIKWP